MPLTTTTPRTLASPGVTSEAGRLRTVLLHRPGEELRQVTPENADAMLFDAPIDSRRAGRDHDAFADALRAHGVEVLLLDDLAVGIGATRIATSGLPNTYFTRDTSVWVGDEVIVGDMATAARMDESRLLRAVYAQHPRFGGDHPQHRITVEGGDVFVPREGVVVVGLGERSTLAGARRILEEIEGVGHVLAIHRPLPEAFHLDLLMSFPDPESVVCHPSVLGAHAISMRTDDPRPRHERDVHGALSEALGLPRGRRARIIDTGLEPSGPHDRVWDHGANLLTIAPGTVVAYDDNTRVNALLREAGLTVVEIPGARLGKGRGGPRCMSCPVARDAV